MISLKYISISKFGWVLKISINGSKVSSIEEELELDSSMGLNGVLNLDDKEIIPKISYIENNFPFHSLQLRENIEYDFSITMPKAKVEYEILQKTNPVYPFENLNLMGSLSFNGEDSCFAIHEKLYRITGRLNFGNFNGSSNLSLNIGVTNIEVPIDVVSHKINYSNEFRVLLEELSEINADLILQLDTPTEIALVSLPEKKNNPQIELFHIQRLFTHNKLHHAVTMVLKQPAYRITTKHQKESAVFTNMPDWQELQMNQNQFDFIKGGPLKESFFGYTPTTLPDRQTYYNYDIVENRYIKYLLHSLFFRMENLKCRLPNNKKTSHLKLTIWLNELQHFIEHPFWKSISECDRFPNSMILSRKAGYRELFHGILSCDNGINLESDIGIHDFSGNLKAIYDLYELWAYFQIYKIIQEITSDYDHEKVAFRFDGSKFLVDILKGNKHALVFSRRKDALKIELYYNKKFTKKSSKSEGWDQSYSVNLIPDISLKIIATNKEHWIHFDAKYKLDITQLKKQLEEETSDEVNDISTYKDNDIHKMHTYRDALLGTRGSYILYPGDEINSNIFVRHANSGYRKSYLTPSIGAFPLIPGNSDQRANQMKNIQSHLENIIDVLFQSHNYQEETGHME